VENGKWKIIVFGKYQLQFEFCNHSTKFSDIFHFPLSVFNLYGLSADFSASERNSKRVERRFFAFGVLLYSQRTN